MSSTPFPDFEFVSVEDRRLARLVTINRPARANALNGKTLAELEAVVDATSGDDAIRLFAVTGAGQKVFCAGADLSEATGENSNSHSAKAYDKRWDDLTGRIAALPCLTVAMLNGACIGGGLSVALAFDFRWGASHAYFRYPVAKHGFMPSLADLERLKSAAGVSVTRKLLLLGEAIPMQLALSTGLADDTIEDGDVRKAVDRLAGQVTEGQARSQLAIKRLLSHGARSSSIADHCYRAVYDMDHGSIDRLRSLDIE